MTSANKSAIARALDVNRTAFRRLLAAHAQAHEIEHVAVTPRLSLLNLVPTPVPRGDRESGAWEAAALWPRGRGRK